MTAPVVSSPIGTRPEPLACPLCQEPASTAVDGTGTIGPWRCRQCGQRWTERRVATYRAARAAAGVQGRHR